MTRRRKFLKSVGSLTVIGAAGTAHAKGKRRRNREKSNEESDEWEKIYEQSLLNSDLHKKISEGFREDGSKKVEEVLEESDIVYDQATVKVDTDRNSGDDSEFTTQDMYTRGEAEMNVLTLNASPADTISVFTQMFLNGTNMSVGSAKYLEDVIGTTWDKEHYEVVGEPYVIAADPHNASFHSESYQEGGLSAKVNLKTNNWLGDLPEGDNGNMAIELYSQLEYIGDNITPIFGHYKHTEAADPSGTIESITVNKGSVEVELSGLESKVLWEKGEFSDPSEYI